MKELKKEGINCHFKAIILSFFHSLILSLFLLNGKNKDKNAAARFSNAVMEQLQLMQQDLYNKANQVALEGLRSGKIKLMSDSGSVSASSIEQYNKLISEYQLMVDTKPPSLIVTEHAKPALYPSRPRRKMILGGITVLSLLFSILAIYVIEAGKSRQHSKAE